MLFLLGQPSIWLLSAACQKWLDRRLMIARMLAKCAGDYSWRSMPLENGHEFWESLKPGLSLMAWG